MFELVNNFQDESSVLKWESPGNNSLIGEHQKQPIGVAIDGVRRKIFWSQVMRGEETIKSASFDGENVEDLAKHFG